MRQRLINDKGISLAMVTGAIGIVGIISFFLFKFVFSFKRDFKATEISDTADFISDQIERVLSDPYFCTALVKGNPYTDALGMTFGMDISIPYNSSYSPTLIGLNQKLSKNSQIASFFDVKKFKFKKISNIQSIYQISGSIYWPIYGELDFSMSNKLAERGEVQGAVTKKIQFFDPGSSAKKNYQLVAILKYNNLSWRFDRCMLANIDCIQAPTSCFNLLSSIGDFLTYNGWKNSWNSLSPSKCINTSSSGVVTISGNGGSYTSNTISCPEGTYLVKETITITGNHNQPPFINSYETSENYSATCCEIGN